MKKANASSANGRPTTAPQRPISRGQKSPSANDRTVPLTAPTANRMPNALAHRRVSAIHTRSPVRFARYSAISSISGRPTPREANTMWKASETAIWIRAACSVVSASTVWSSTSAGSPPGSIPATPEDPGS